MVALSNTNLLIKLKINLSELFNISYLLKMHKLIVVCFKMLNHFELDYPLNLGWSCTGLYQSSHKDYDREMTFHGTIETKSSMIDAVTVMFQKLVDAGHVSHFEIETVEKN